MDDNIKIYKYLNWDKRKMNKKAPKTADIVKEVSFIDMTHKAGVQTRLTELNTIMETPEGIKTPLFPHQKTVLRAMLDIEEQRYIKLSHLHQNYYQHSDRYDPIIAETTALILSEPYGSGKTLVILSFIAARLVPTAYTEGVTKRYYDKREDGVHPVDAAQVHRYMESIDRNKIEIKHKFNSWFIKPNLIIVGRNVINQYLEEIKTKTTLKVFAIRNVVDYRDFVKLFQNNSINEYDIILAKNGKIADENENIVMLLCKLTMNHCWTRVIYDDFDQLITSIGSVGFNSIFTIYVSTTTVSN